MNYWITTQWPPRVDEPESDSWAVWLPDDRMEAGRDLAPGDLVLIYQSRNGRPELQRYADGTEEVFGCIEGREGIIAIGRITDRLQVNPDEEPKHYANGTQICWSASAPMELLSRSGFVPRLQLNRVLGYKDGCRLRGFGDRHSGLKRITAEEYARLAALFRKGNPVRLPPSPSTCSIHEIDGNGGTGESDAHRHLKEYIASNPSTILGEPGLRTVALEYLFPTGDRADVVMEDHAGRIVGVEVEVVVGEKQWEGVLQAIKYRYMLEPLTQRHPGDSRAFLVAYDIMPSMKKQCERYGVQCISVDRKRVEDWGNS